MSNFSPREMGVVVRTLFCKSGSTMLLDVVLNQPDPIEFSLNCELFQAATGRF